MLSVSIVTFQIEKSEFSLVLKSLNKAAEYLYQTIKERVNVKIIDNGDQKALLNEIIEASVSPSVNYELLIGHGNIGYGRANNLAIKESKSKYHLVLNPDIIMEENCLGVGLEYLESLENNNNEKVCAISPRATNEKGEFQYLCKRFPSVLNFLLRGFAPQKVKSLFKKRLDYYELRDRIKADSNEVVKDVPLISGCFMLCSTEDLQKTGGFNESFFLHFEDLALSMELRKLGVLDYFPKMRVMHYGGNSSKNGFKHILIFIRSGIRFFNIYGWKLV